MMSHFRVGQKIYVDENTPENCGTVRELRGDRVVVEWDLAPDSEEYEMVPDSPSERSWWDGKSIWSEMNASDAMQMPGDVSVGDRVAVELSSGPQPGTRYEGRVLQIDEDGQLVDVELDITDEEVAVVGSDNITTHWSTLEVL